MPCPCADRALDTDALDFGGCAERPVAAKEGQPPECGRPSVLQLLAQAAEEHEREVADLRLYYEAQLKAVHEEPEEKQESKARNTISGSVSPINVFEEHDIMASAETTTGAVTTGLAPGCRSPEEEQVDRISRNESRDTLRDGKRKSSFRRGSSQIAVLHDAGFQHPEHGWRQGFENHIDIIATAVVMLHIAFLIVQMQYGGQQIAEQAGIIASHPGSDDHDFAFDVIAHAFNVFFILEMLARIACLKKDFFWTLKGSVQWFNILELLLVTATSIDLYFSPGRDFNFNAFRPLVRFVRLLRMTRVMRMVKFFFKLRVLVSTVAASFMALFWSIVLLVITMLMAALTLNQFLIPELLSEHLPFSRREWIYQMYGTSLKAFYTVFELTFSGGWPTYARPLVEEVSPYWAIFFFIYIISVTFAMFRIITALFLRDTLALAADDAETAIREKVQQKDATVKKLREFFEVADTSGDGMLSLTEFEEMLELPRVRTWLSLLEIDVHDAKELFALLEDADGNVSVDDFVSGMMRIKGHAKSQEVHEILVKQRRMCETLAHVMQRVENIDMSMIRKQQNAVATSGHLLI